MSFYYEALKVGAGVYGFSSVSAGLADEGSVASPSVGSCLVG